MFEAIHHTGFHRALLGPNAPSDNAGSAGHKRREGRRRLLALTVSFLFMLDSLWADVCTVAHIPDGARHM